jgi:HPt (histidine-containing phosphotransfer) domain-containing protein
MNKITFRTGLQCLAVLTSLLCFATIAQAQRPTYSVAETTINADPPGVDCTATPGSCFKIHYVTSTIDAPSTTDADMNGTPDYIDSLRAVLIDVFGREITNMGWTAPPSDSIAPGGNGGDGRIDVYVRNVGCGSIASVRREGAVSAGSNSFYSFVQFHTDVKACYDGLSAGGPGELTSLTQLQVIEDVFAHEYHHVLQDGINGFSTGQFKEASANWMNDEAYDELNVNIRSSVLGDFRLFNSPTTSLNSISYGGWFWLRYLSERFGVSAVKDTWQQLATVPAPADPTQSVSEFPSMNTTLTGRGSSLKAAWVDFSGKLYAKDWFEEGSTYPDIMPTGLVNGGSPFSTYPVSSPASTTVNHMARRYYLFNPSSPAAMERTLQIAFNGPDGQDSGGVVVFQTADGRRIDQGIALNGSNDGNSTVPGFSLSPPPASDFARATSAVLVMSNATQSTDALTYSFCSPNCSVSGGADPMITPWGADWGYRQPLYQTVDIWVDNNNNCMTDAPGRPGCNEPDNPMTTAIDAEPSKGRSNTLKARIRNLGNVAVTGVSVQLRYSPYGLGLPGPIFANIGSPVVVDLAAAGDAGGNDVRVIQVPWNLIDLTFNNSGQWDVASTSNVETINDFDHFCVRAEITSASDINTGNNLAQNNFADVPTAPSADGRVNFLVGNPFRTESDVELVLDPPLPTGWLAKVSGVPLGQKFRLKPGQLEMASISISRPPDARPLTKDVVANLSLKINGERVSGLSILLVRGQPSAPPLDSYSYCLCETETEYEDLRHLIKRLSKNASSVSAREISDVEARLRKQSELLKRREDSLKQQKYPSSYVRESLQDLRKREEQMLEMLGKLLRKALPSLSAADKASLLDGFKSLLDNHPELMEKFADLWAGPKATSRLLLITPGPELDYGKLENLAMVYDHYFDDTANGWQQQLIAEVREETIESLKRLPLTYQVLDRSPPQQQRYYYWAYRYETALPKLKAMGANFLLTRSGKTAALISLPGALNLKDYDSLQGAVITPVNTGSIPVAWIRPETYQRLREILGQPLRRGGGNPIVNEIIGGLSTEDCRTFLNQLTGNTPISVGGTSSTISTRFSSGSEIVTLMNWLVDDLRSAGLDAQLDTFFSTAHGRELQQVVVTIPGTDLANQLVLVTAHLDVVSGTQGADDNGSGIVAMICAAKRMVGHRFRRTIQFVAFNAEEQGLIGSTSYARRLMESGRWNICGAFNLDMVAFDQDNDRRIQLQTNGTPASNLMNERIIQNINDYAINLVPVRVTDNEESSDYAAFWRIGQPSINIGDEYFLCDSDCGPTPRPARDINPPTGDFTPCYHRPCDNMSEPHLRMDMIMEVSKMLIATVSDVAIIQS